MHILECGCFTPSYWAADAVRLFANNELESIENKAAEYRAKAERLLSRGEFHSQEYLTVTAREEALMWAADRLRSTIRRVEAAACR